MDKMDQRAMHQVKSWLRYCKEITPDWEAFFISEIERIKAGEEPKIEDGCKGCGKPKKEFKELVAKEKAKDKVKEVKEVKEVKIEDSKE